MLLRRESVQDTATLFEGVEQSPVSRGLCAGLTEQFPVGLACGAAGDEVDGMIVNIFPPFDGFLYSLDGQIDELAFAGDVESGLGTELATSEFAVGDFLEGALRALAYDLGEVVFVSSVDVAGRAELFGKVHDGTPFYPWEGTIVSPRKTTLHKYIIFLVFLQ